MTSIGNKAPSRLLIGIDLGTTRVKVGVYDVYGHRHCLAALNAPFAVRSNGERSEGDAESWWRICCQALQTCLKQTEASRVIGVCVGGQGPSLVAVDANGKVLRPAIMYDDFRAIGEAQEASAELNQPITVRRSYLPRALWIRDHEPNTYAATRWFLQAWDFLVYRLTGSAAATSPLGSYTPWQENDLAILGLDCERFPASIKTTERVAAISAQASSETGLPRGIPVIAGGNDFLIGTIGVAGAQKGIAQSQGGATGAFSLCWDRPLVGAMIGWCIPSPVIPDLLNIGSPITTAGVALDWLLHSVLGLSVDYEAALAGASRVPVGAEGLLFFPYLAGEELAGRPEARGVFLGLSLQHKADHLIRSVLEGVAFAGRSVMETLLEAGGRVDEVVTYGGQTRSALWNQIKADIWHRPVRVPEPADAGTLGAAAIAATGVGLYSTLAEASEQMGRRGHIYQPNPERTALYDKAYVIYSGIYPQLRELFPQLAAIREIQTAHPQQRTYADEKLAARR